MNKPLKYSIISAIALAIVISTLFILDTQPQKESPIIPNDLDSKVVENLVEGLIQAYDKKGIENLRNANYNMLLTGEAKGIRYLYIYDPTISKVVGESEDAPKLLPLSFPTDVKQDKGVWSEEKIGDLSVKKYFVFHDGLFFVSGYSADL